MRGILSALRSGKFQCYGPAGVDGDDHPAAREATAPGPPRGKFIETPRPSELFIPVPQVAADDPLLFRFFIDGSERVTAAGFIIDPKKRYLPLLIAQVAVATTELHASRLTIKHYDSSNTFFFPDSFAKEDLTEAKEVVCTAAKSSRLPLNLDFDYYQVDDTDKLPMDRARAKVLQKMHSMEICRIADLARGGEISRDSLLLIDGSIDFYTDMDRHKEAFRNVVGVAKSFDLHRRFHVRSKGAERVGALISRLLPGTRTPALGTQHRNLTIASWYLRLQGRRRIPGLEPQDGVIKIEVFPNAASGDTPTIDAARCDRLSEHIFALRAPATPNTDARWASNLYPVYLTERYIKTRFRSHHSIRACL